MKILLTGKPKSGKTTLLKSVLSDLGSKQGFITEEIISKGVRTGFISVSSEGTSEVIADVNSTSNTRVSKYGVNVDQFSAFIHALPAMNAANLLYIDEIGQMQLCSDDFKLLVEQYLDAPNLYLGTITRVYRDSFTDSVLNREDVILLNVSQDNLSQIRTSLNAFVYNFKILSSLDEATNLKVTNMAKDYARGDNYLQLMKLFKNGVRYKTEGRITSVGSGKYKINGDHGNHVVIVRETEYACDCDLFKGEGSYVDSAGECSHIQAVKLLFA